MWPGREQRMAWAMTAVGRWSLFEGSAPGLLQSRLSLLSASNTAVSERSVKMACAPIG